MDVLHLFVITDEGVFEGTLDNQGNLVVSDQLLIPFDTDEGDIPYKPDTTV